MDDGKNRSGISRCRRIGESRSRRPIRFAGQSARFVRYLFEYRTPKITEIYKRVRGERQNKESIVVTDEAGGIRIFAAYQECI